MFTAEAHVTTDNAAKYLKWLCGHFKIKVPVEYDKAQGRVEFSIGVCQIQALPNSLFMRVEASNAEALAQVKFIVSDHLERFAHKEGVQVVWNDQS